MPSTNAFTDPPLLPAPAKYRFHTRTASRSPTKQQIRDLDPLLRDLSPTTTLRAFLAEPGDTNSCDALSNSIRSSSTGERALGAKAAQACLDLRTWTREMEDWHWPGTFDVPEPARKKARLSTMTFNSVLSGTTTASKEESGEDEEEYWGSLPSKTVLAYEKRADEIGQRLDQVDVEDLKEYVLATHRRTGTRPPSREDSIGAFPATTDLKKFDDFTVLVTATILQALPFLSKLSRLLDTWTMRLIILRHAPSYLRDLKHAQTDLDHGWAAIAVSPSTDSDPYHASFDRKTLLDMRRMIEQQVGSLGRRLDRFLDDLEGRDDTVPDTWIDEFELLESAYGSWIVQAERKVFEQEWREIQEGAQLAAAQRHNGRVNAISEFEVPELDHDAVMQPRQESPSQEPASAKGEDQRTTTDSSNPTEDDLASRTIPTIVADEHGETQDTNDSVMVSPTINQEGEASSSSSVQDAQSQSLAKKRAAFLGEIERTNSLKQSKSPVRPFERANNAFTKLFKKDHGPEQVKVKRSTSSKLSSSSSSADVSSTLPSMENAMPQKGEMASAVTVRGEAGGHERTDSTPAELPPQSEHNNLRDTPQPLPQTLPETYQPTGLSSPFHSPSKSELPEDWPLASPVGSPVKATALEQHIEDPVKFSGEDYDGGNELHTPAVPIESDAFDSVFVQAFANNVTERRPESARASSKTAAWREDQKRSASLPRSIRRAVADTSKRGRPSDYLDMLSTKPPRDTSASPMSRSRERRHISSGPRIPLAGRVEQPAKPGLNDLGMMMPSSSKQARPASSPSVNFHPPVAEPTIEESDGERPTPIKRASVTSIELFSRAQLRSIDVPKSSRQSSISSRFTPPQTPPHLPTARGPLLPDDADINEPHFDSSGDMVTMPIPLGGHTGGQTPPIEGTPILRETDPNRGTEWTQSSPLGALSSPEGGPLNAAMKKRRGVSNLRNGNSPPNASNTKRSTRFDPGEDNFDRHVSEVLETLPTDIRFKARPGADTPIPHAGDPRGYSAPRPKVPHPRRASKGGSMTIVPAETSPKKSSLASDPEVKLYHLTQVGRDEPIKLFVRLVGEGERVMVRVGGGWADLADYLRQYAVHHGSRTVSEGGLEVQTVSNALTRKASGPAESRAKTPVLGALRPDSSDSDKDWPIRPNTGYRLENGRATPTSERGRQTPTASTPKSSSTSSRPSTANVSRPPSRQNTGEVGLGGPSSGKKSGLSEHKAKWVEGMIERAKQMSAEKTREDTHFSELGRAGGTRRVIFRSSSGAANGEKTK